MRVTRHPCVMRNHHALAVALALCTVTCAVASPLKSKRGRHAVGVVTVERIGPEYRCELRKAFVVAPVDTRDDAEARAQNKAGRIEGVTHLQLRQQGRFDWEARAYHCERQRPEVAGPDPDAIIDG